MGIATVNVAPPLNLNPDELDVFYRHGASFRMVAEVTDDGIHSVMNMPGGQRHFRDSPYYNSLLEDYLENVTFEMVFDVSQVEAVETIEVLPAE